MTGEQRGERDCVWDSNSSHPQCCHEWSCHNYGLVMWSGIFVTHYANW